jgi:hypothetical protein
LNISRIRLVKNPILSDNETPYFLYIQDLKSKEIKMFTNIDSLRLAILSIFNDKKDAVAYLHKRNSHKDKDFRNQLPTFPINSALKQIDSNHTDNSEWFIDEGWNQ